MWGTPTRIQVQNPKTKLAQIRQVTTGVPVKGSTFKAESFFEGMTTSDGHLMS